MAGSDTRFDAAAFREAITFAMNMGLPDDETQRATFKWNRDATYATADADGSPFNWTETPTSEITFEDVQIPVALEFVSKGGDTLDIRLGQMDVSRCTITVLDTYFAELTQNGVFANQVELDDALYDIQFVSPPLGLFDVTIYQIHCQAIDEA